jgi:hypothetical protein
MASGRVPTTIRTGSLESEFAAIATSLDGQRYLSGISTSIMRSLIRLPSLTIA